MPGPRFSFISFRHQLEAIPCHGEKAITFNLLVLGVGLALLLSLVPCLRGNIHHVVIFEPIISLGARAQFQRAKSRPLSVSHRRVAVNFVQEAHPPYRLWSNIRQRANDVVLAASPAGYPSKAIPRGKMLNNFSFADVKIGDVVKGVVRSASEAYVSVDVGGPPWGVLPTSEITKEVAGEGILSPGDCIKAVVTEKDNDRPRFSLSTKVLEKNSGDMLHNRSSVFETAEEMGRLFAKRLAEKEAVERRFAEKGVTFEDLRIGDVVEGLVRSVSSAYALVDIGAQITGRLPVSEITSGRIRTAASVFSLGDIIKALVIEKNGKRGTFNLSTKELEKNHGDMLHNRDAVFETAEDMGKSFREELAKKDAEERRIADEDKRRIAEEEVVERSARQKRAEEKRRTIAKKRKMFEEKAALLKGVEVGDLVEGVVRQVSRDKALVTVRGAEAYLPKHHLSNQQANVSVENVLSIGDHVKALVIKKDVGRSSLKLGTRSLEQDRGDMVRNSTAVFENAEQMHKLIHERFVEDVVALEHLMAGGEPTTPEMVLREELKNELKMIRLTHSVLPIDISRWVHERIAQMYRDRTLMSKKKL